ncbi:hypothetical protein LDENG_00119350 [Lucifuga dentata]|nr:hypothetical protein LDENG_00119350 [Lucifuga dentata]
MPCGSPYRSLPYSPLVVLDGAQLGGTCDWDVHCTSAPPGGAVFSQCTRLVRCIHARRCYAPELPVKMADEEAEQERNAERGVSATTQELRRRLQQVQAVLVRDSTECPGPSSSRYCEEFCRTLLKYADRWSMEEDPLRLMEVYMEAVVSYAQASTYLSLQCENVPLVLERLCLSFVELLLSLKEEVPDDLWNQFKLSVQFAHCKLQDSGVAHLALLAALSHQTGVWTNCVLQGLLSNDKLPTQQVEEFLELEGPVLMEMRVKQLMKKKEMEKAAMLAKICSESSAFQGRGAFRQMLLVCICATSQNQQLMDENSSAAAHHLVYTEVAAARRAGATQKHHF